jgi:hypothetical protein
MEPLSLLHLHADHLLTIGFIGKDAQVCRIAVK